MPQQQPGLDLYRGGDYDEDEMSVSLVEETGVPGGNHRQAQQALEGMPVGWDRFKTL